MSFDFDKIIDRRASDSAKWGYYDDDLLPMWVADMDFESPAPIIEALHRRVDHKVFGYAFPAKGLREALGQRMKERHHWDVEPDQINFLPGLVCGLNVLCRAIGQPGDGVLVNTPVYMPFLSAPGNQGRELNVAILEKTMVKSGNNEHIHYEIDFDALEDAITPQTRLFILCNPHNPIGRAYTRSELMQIAEICTKHDLVICSDEIHCDLLLGDTEHISIASLSPEIADRTITLIAPSKTFNIPGLGCSAAIIQNPELRTQMDNAAKGIVPHVNLMGYHAALAAYTQCEEWRQALLQYLTANRDFLKNYVDEHLPTVRTTVPEATYLAWLDCSATGIEGNAQEFFKEKAKVVFNDGPAFGAGGEGFVRLNFGCPRATLKEGLDKMRAALS